MSLPALGQPLEIGEVSRLADLEAVIERGVQTFVEVGQALMEVRDARLYRLSHGTFEDYCRERWGWGRSHTYRLMDGAQVAHLVSPTGDIERPNERQARELVPLMREAPEMVPEAWREANERTGGHVTAVDVREVVAERRGQGRLTALYASDSDEWYTPPAVIERVLRAFPVIDLDPCSNPDAIKPVPATTHYTRQDDGLAQSWAGRIFINPPYSKVDQFAAKIATEHVSGNVGEAIILVPARTETRWWRLIPATVVAFFHGRLRFLNALDTETAAAPFPSAALYVGPHPDRFAAAFADVALVYRRVEP